MSLLPTVGGCCDPQCDEGVVTQVPGPQGPAGADGTNGTDGVSAFTYVANYSPDPQPVMPAEGDSVTLNTTTSTTFVVPDQIVFVEPWGYMLVTAVPSASSITVQNPAVAASGIYPDNATPGTPVPASSKITLAGIQGPAGAAAPGGTYFAIANNLNEGTPATMRSNLGLGNAATRTVGVLDTNLAPNDGALTSGRVVVSTATGLSTPPAATARTALGLGTAAIRTVGVADGNLAPNDGALTANELVIATAIGLQTVTASVAKGLLGIGANTGGYGLLFRVNAQSLDLIADIAVSLSGLTKFRLDKVTLSNPTTALGTARFGVFGSTGGAGTAYALAQIPPVVSGGTAKFGDLVLEAVAGTDYITGPFYVRITTAQALQTVDISVWGWDLS